MVDSICQVREHKLVLGVFDDVETDRKAWRLVGGVLIPGTVPYWQKLYIARIY